MGYVCLSLFVCVSLLKDAEDFLVEGFRLDFFLEVDFYFGVGVGVELSWRLFGPVF